MATPIDLSRYSPKGALHRRALRRYAEFWAALQAVGEALGQAEKLAGKLHEAQRQQQKAKASSGAGGRRSWAAATPEELRAAAKKADGSLRIIATSAKRWEADLVSREWGA